MDTFKPETYNYLLGQNILVAPITSETATVTISFPGDGNQDQWVYWFNHSLVYKAGDVKAFTVPLDEFSVFMKAGEASK